MPLPLPLPLPLRGNALLFHYHYKSNGHSPDQFHRVTENLASLLVVSTTFRPTIRLVLAMRGELSNEWYTFLPTRVRDVRLNMVVVLKFPAVVIL